jgi:hypothetical protein
MLPKWFGKKANPIPMDVAHSYHTAPGWRLCGKPSYTCVEPAAGPSVDPDVLRAIREFDPGAIPIWQIQAYLPPGKMGFDGVIRVAHVGIARYVRDPRGSATLFRVEMPEGSTDPQPNILDFLWIDNAPTLLNGGPGTVLPFDWSLYQHCLEKFNANTNPLHLVRDWMDRTDDRNAKVAAQVEEDLEYRRRTAEKNISRILDKVTYKELFNQYMEIRQRGRLSERKTMVFHGGR